MPTYKRVVTIRRAEYIPQGTGGGRRQYEMVILSISASSAVSFRVAIIREKTIYTLIYRPPAASKVVGQDGASRPVRTWVACNIRIVVENVLLYSVYS